MKPSIRTYLLINLLLSVFLISSLAIIANIFFSRKDIQSQLDSALISTSQRIQILLSSIPDHKHLKRKQIEINALTNTSDCEDDLSTTVFQLWDKNGQLILHSANAPKTPLSKGMNGLTTHKINSISWRVYTSTIKKQSTVLMVAENYSFRLQLEHRLTKDSTLIMLLTYPFLGLLIWIIVGRALTPIKRIAQEIEQRAPSYLHPVNNKSVPKEIKPLINALNHLFERLLDAFNREKRFTADAAHELRTPLAAINAHAQVALKTEDRKALDSILLKMVGSVTRSTHVIQQLLTLTRLVPEASINDPIRMNLETEAARTAAEIVPDALKKNIEIELVTTGDFEPTIFGNPTAISILVRNLIDNAVRYSPHGSEVSIHIESTSKDIILSVIDNGPGIPEELRERVFERFYRVLGTDETGSGLGLGIVLKIIKLHQADIALETAPSGQGLKITTTFRRLP